MNRFDVVVIGAGLGGLFSAALLKAKYPSLSVCILEAHTASGGCASYFDRFIKLDPTSDAKTRIRFDAGATTLSGVELGQPIHSIIQQLGIDLPIHHCEIGARIVLQDGTEIVRYADRSKWRDESARVFGETTRAFWHDIESLAAKAWGITSSYPLFPSANLRDLASFIPAFRPAHISIAINSLRSLNSLLEKHGLQNHIHFRRFLDEQLLISLQCLSNEAPLLLSALALDYPSETYYVDGGMYAISQVIEDSFTERGGVIKFKREVASISYSTDNRYSITTTKGEVYHAKTLISNIPLWNTQKILADIPSSTKHFFENETSSLPKNIWGGLDLYGLIEDTIDNKGSLYHQLHSDNYSVFLSLSRRGDTSRAPMGYRVFSCSTHEAQPEAWFDIDDTTYALKKAEALKKVESPLMKFLGGYEEAAKPIVEFATPRTFQFYTRRMFGRVGGIPHSLNRKLWQWTPNAAPMKGFYLVGDTIFPGQGTPAIGQCALNLVERISRDGIIS